MIVYLPQRFQVLLGDSALMAGARLLGYSGVTAFSSTFAIIISTKLRVPFLPILIFGAMISIAGTALFSTLPLSNEWPASGYGYEIMAGCGMGIAYGISMFALPYMLDLKDVRECRFKISFKLQSLTCTFLIMKRRPPVLLFRCATWEVLWVYRLHQTSSMGG